MSVEHPRRDGRGTVCGLATLECWHVTFCHDMRRKARIWHLTDARSHAHLSTNSTLAPSVALAAVFSCY